MKRVVTTFLFYGLAYFVLAILIGFNWLPYPGDRVFLNLNISATLYAFAEFLRHGFIPLRVISLASLYKLTFWSTKISFDKLNHIFEMSQFENGFQFYLKLHNACRILAIFFGDLTRYFIDRYFGKTHASRVFYALFHISYIALLFITIDESVVDKMNNFVTLLPMSFIFINMFFSSEASAIFSNYRKWLDEYGRRRNEQDEQLKIMVARSEEVKNESL